MIVQNSPYISVTTASEPCFCKIAPGMSNQYHVNCCAIDCRDYKVDLTFVSEDMTVNVPVFGKDKKNKIRNLIIAKETARTSQ